MCLGFLYLKRKNTIFATKHIPRSKQGPGNVMLIADADEQYCLVLGPSIIKEFCVAFLNLQQDLEFFAFSDTGIPDWHREPMQMMQAEFHWYALLKNKVNTLLFISFGSQTKALQSSLPDFTLLVSGPGSNRQSASWDHQKHYLSFMSSVWLSTLLGASQALPVQLFAKDLFLTSSTINSCL